MKKFKKIFYLVISVCVCAVLVFASGCSTPPLTGNLFDEEVLKRARIPFLSKPENPIDESYTLYEDSYSYTCYSDVYDYLFRYAEEQFNKFISAGLTTAYCSEYVNTGDLLYIGERYFLLRTSSSFDDYETTYSLGLKYRIYYSTEKTSDLKMVEGYGLKIIPYYLTFYIESEPAENGLFRLIIALGGEKLMKKYNRYYIVND